MNWKEQLPAIVWLGVGLAIAKGAYDLGTGTLNNPGPGLFAFVIGVSMAVLSLSIALTSVRAMAPSDAKAPTPGRPLPVLAVMVALIFYALALERIGFVICTLLFLFGLLSVLGRKSPSVAMAASIGITVGSYLVLAKLLKINLPAGPFGL